MWQIRPLEQKEERKKQHQSLHVALKNNDKKLYACVT